MSSGFWQGEHGKGKNQAVAALLLARASDPSLKFQRLWLMLTDTTSSVENFLPSSDLDNVALTSDDLVESPSVLQFH